MEDFKRETAFYKLNKILTLNTGLVEPNKQDQTITLKGKTPEEVMKKYYEAQQGQYLKDNFYSVEKSFLQQVMHYEAQRIHAFQDYEGMEYYPLIASALDLYMEEATTIGDNGKMLNIYSKSPRIKKILEEFFYDIVNVNVNLPSWVRSVCKYGDNFVYLLPEKGKGITMVKQLLNMDMERKEDMTPEGKLKVFFRKRSNSQELSRIEVGHFRLLGDDKYLPYGASILNKVRKYWRMCLHEDTNILTESGFKKIKDIKINDIVYSYDHENNKTIKTRVSKTLNNGIRKTFKVRSKFGEIILTDDHPILILNENKFEYKNIKNINIEEDYVVSPVIDGDYNKIKISKIIEISEYGENNVYDIEIDHPTHNFIAENIVVHNCIMAEDAMLTYRILRAGDKRVYKIDVGNMPTEDILPYMQEAAKTLKRKPNINPDNANIDYRFNIMGNDEDIFMPTRNGNSGTVIDTLEGAQNLNDINDIEYLRDMLFTGLGIPKPFLGYQNTAGDGKNVAQLDMRFSKKVNRIQQAVIQELTNMAVIHLYMLGFEEEFSNFSLTLSPPSTQADILKTDLLQAKSSLYNEMTQPLDNGIAGVSHTWAKMNIYNWSEDDIIKDLERQFLERIVTQEIQNATSKVAKSGIFTDVLAKYGVKPGEQPIGNPQEDEEGGGLGGGIGDITPDIGGGAEPPAAPEGGGEPPAFGESFSPSRDIINNLKDEKSKMVLESSNNLINKSKKIVDEVIKNKDKE